ncbi:hypothetical protein PR048_024460 [Dryococelus australis]|uniref:Uncharacterized protein n=1 Tax=Dryococelus australis TaxID=614101 RepID=A0ABQ9GNQ7_9NEOP|nr:hypothetical protein PR048_024460 [Dryococelus australis]
MWESCRTIPLVCRFSRGSPVSPALLFRRCSILSSFTHIGSQDLDVKSHPNLFTHSSNIVPMQLKYVKDKIDFKRVYTEVTFAIGSEFIRHALDDCTPIADLQANEKRIPYCQMWETSSTGQQTGTTQQIYGSVARGRCLFVVGPSEREDTEDGYVRASTSAILISLWNHAQGATVAERLVCSPPTKVNLVRSPAGSPDFRKWEWRRTIPLVGGFSRGSSISPTPPHSGAAPHSLQSPSSAFKTSLLRASQISSLFTHSVRCIRRGVRTWRRGEKGRGGLDDVTGQQVPWQRDVTLRRWSISSGVRVSGERGGQARGPRRPIQRAGCAVIKVVTHNSGEMERCTVVLKPHQLSDGKRNILQ